MKRAFMNTGLEKARSWLAMNPAPDLQKPLSEAGRRWLHSIPPELRKYVASLEPQVLPLLEEARLFF